MWWGADNFFESSLRRVCNALIPGTPQWTKEGHEEKIYQLKKKLTEKAKREHWEEWEEGEYTPEEPLKPEQREVGFQYWRYTAKKRLWGFTKEVYRPGLDTIIDKPIAPEDPDLDKWDREVKLRHAYKMLQLYPGWQWK